MPKKPAKAALSQSGHKPTQPTLIDVAKVAGVSPITVSRALSRPEVVSEKTRQKVIEAVRQTGYVSNMLAGSLASNRSRLVAIFLPTIANSIFADTVQALMDRLTQAGYQTLLGLTGYSAEQEEKLLEAILGRRPDGIVLTGTLHTESSRLRLAQSGIPVVEAWDLSDDPLDMLVGFSHEKVGEAIARHLLGKGYRRFSIVSLGDPRGLRRCNSLIAELGRHGIDQVPLQVMTPPATLKTGRDGLQALLEQHDRPEVVVCSSDTIAQGVLAEAASRGLRVPEDLAVMGFGDLSSAAQVYPALSTVSVNGQAIGLQVAEALLERFDHADNSVEPLRIDSGFTLIDRQTT
ncbi:LacI family DNA-binding transcriptional regulator [Pseudomonas sp. DTU_2021_1001937_2_SI_NGA_ILE_001]|uniref:LacI family DNA-binding transcriptional regulator n=1 Tax=Pseudomonas sp. DTU_2021_1001937_2_SI_NGA_ILE_001 TaxID=3077589 RepID=UPI0028FC3071|nr:LacI family DNA-binding transcriptional regulator [Pseudomonas sp. DTU_2021_1001937_2_SI_NGA_ILE_001]WNW12951.1 LacI family DNA-binding transcriptional regulator [Pseudomonas sp. DTU_2021_1001937_2_SI_NGA_ILE_001]